MSSGRGVLERRHVTRGKKMEEAAPWGMEACQVPDAHACAHAEARRHPVSHQNQSKPPRAFLFSQTARRKRASERERALFGQPDLFLQPRCHAVLDTSHAPADVSAHTFFSAVHWLPEAWSLLGGEFTPLSLLLAEKEKERRA